MFAADAQLQVGTGLATTLGGDLHQLAYTLLIQHIKRILFENSFCEICRQNLGHVIAGESEGGLREIVRTEGKELRLPGDFIRHKCGTRQLDHGADEIADLVPFFFEYLLRNPVHNLRSPSA